MAERQYWEEFRLEATALGPWKFHFDLDFQIVRNRWPMPPSFPNSRRNVQNQIPKSTKGWEELGSKPEVLHPNLRQGLQHVIERG
jgi:hypothetical protein